MLKSCTQKAFFGATILYVHSRVGGVDEQNLVSSAGLVPALELAEQDGLSRSIGEHVDLPSTRAKSGAVNLVGKLTSIIAGIMCGADSIDDVNALGAKGTLERRYL